MKSYIDNKFVCEDCFCIEFQRVQSRFLRGFKYCFRCGLVQCGRRLYAMTNGHVERVQHFSEMGDLDGEL
jgi:uncharacterized UBP type Zn finger protein